MLLKTSAFFARLSVKPSRKACLWKKAPGGRSSPRSDPFLSPQEDKSIVSRLVIAWGSPPFPAVRAVVPRAKDWPPVTSAFAAHGNGVPRAYVWCVLGHHAWRFLRSEWLCARELDSIPHALSPLAAFPHPLITYHDGHGGIGVHSAAQKKCIIG
jgi:hypothetical protein